MRLADALDFSHKSVVQSIEAQQAVENVTVQGAVLLNPILEEYALNKKKDVFEKFFKKKVILTWKQSPTPSTATRPTVEPTIR